MSKLIELLALAKGLYCAKDLYDNAQQSDDLELERRALKACGYRVHEKERNGTRWLTACKGLQVQYKHWHPLTNIHQAMQLLEERQELSMTVSHSGVTVVVRPAFTGFEGWGDGLVLAQCRAIVTACASLEPVR